MDYLEDILEETVRERAREHLEACPECRAAAGLKLSLGADLKRLNNLEPPDTLVLTFTHKVRKHVKSKINMKTFATAAAVAFVLALLLIPVAPKIGRWLHAAYLESEIIQQAEPEALRQLKAIARRLGADTGENRAAQARMSLNKGVILKPLHLHMQFNSEEDRNGFVAEIYRTAPDISFRSPDFWVVSLRHDQLIFMLNLLKFRKIKADGVLLADAELFPEFDGTVRVSFYLGVPVDPAALTFFQHWHLLFHLPNQFLLLEKLQELNIKLEYQAPEVWVFEAPASELKKMRETVRNFAGIKIDFGREALLPDSGDIKTKVVIYLKDA